VQIESSYGKAIIRALVTDRQARGSVFVPMHWSDQNSAEARIGAVVKPATDPVSGQPASKNVAVAVSRYRAAIYGFAVSVAKPDVADADYWALAKADGGWRLELAFHNGIEDWMAWCRKSFGIADHIEPLGYADQQSGDRRIAFFDGERLLAALFLAREPVAVARNWAVSQLTADHSNLRRRFAVIAGRPGADRPDPGATVCSCFSIGVNQIVAAVRSGCRSVEAIGNELKAGTNCGSCRAEIRGIINACVADAAE
jgi:assimilatory nitrate reductase catalytic subunit